MEELTKLFRYVTAPENNWGTFSRKVIGVVVSSTLGALVFGMYYNFYQKPKAGESPVSVIVQGDKSKESRVRQVLSALLSEDRNIESVWLYSWPDARQLVPVMHVGDSKNPLPNGSFIISDSNRIGLFLFGECGSLDRGFENYTCPVNGLENSWGVLVVSYGDSVGDESREMTNAKVKAAAHRIGLILYSNSRHNGTLAK